MPRSSEPDSRGDSKSESPRRADATFFLHARPPAEPPTGVEPGQRLGDARLVRFIDKGGMGEVWEAVQESLGRKIAVKVVRSDRHAPQMDERFSVEARACARVSHPGIVTVYGHGNTEGVAWIAMEYIEGCWTLRDFLDEQDAGASRSKGHFHDIATFLLQITDAMEAAHRAIVIHRDLKPQNILITPDDRPKVADFGLARLADEPSITRTGDFAGSYYYTSPEQITAGRVKLDHRTDVFSLGVIAYEMLTLRRPFEGGSEREVSRQVLSKEPPALRSVRADVPRPLETITSKCIEKDPDRRYASMEALGDDLRRYLSGEPIRAQPIGSVTKAARWVRSRRTQVAGVGAVAALVLIAWLVSVIASGRVAQAESDRDSLYSRAELQLEQNDVDEACALIEEAVEIDPDDPTGHLILAAGFAKFGRIPEMREQLSLAREKGFRHDDESAQTGLEHMASALGYLGERDPRAHPAAIRHFERAVEVEPARVMAHYGLYLIHEDQEDLEAARADLARFREGIATGHPFYGVSGALAEELNGSPEIAREMLLEIEREFADDPQRLIDLRLDRHLGRICVKVKRYDEAERYLLRAVTVEDDCWSRSAFGALALARFQADPTNDRRLDEVRSHARAALECSPSIRDARVLEALAAIEVFHRGAASAPESRASDEWRAARAAIDALEHWHPDDPDLKRLEAQLLLAEMRYPFAAGDDRTVVELCFRSVAIDPEAIRAWAVSSECLWWIAKRLKVWWPDARIVTAPTGGGLFVLATVAARAAAGSAHAAGLESAERAHTIWEGGHRSAGWRPKLFGDFAPWGFDHASRLGDIVTAERWKGRIADVLDDTARMPAGARANYAEFLATARDEAVRDCDLALEIAAKVDAELPEVGRDPGIQTTLDGVFRACGE